MSGSNKVDRFTLRELSTFSRSQRFELFAKAMRSVNIIEYSIKIQVRKIILQKFSYNFNPIFSVAKMVLFCRNLNIAKIFFQKNHLLAFGKA